MADGGITGISLRGVRKLIDDKSIGVRSSRSGRQAGSAKPEITGEQHRLLPGRRPRR